MFCEKTSETLVRLPSSEKKVEPFTSSLSVLKSSAWSTGEMDIND